MSDIVTTFFPFVTLIGTILICLLVEGFDFDRRIVPPIAVVGTLLSLTTVILGIGDQTKTYVFGNPADLLDLTSSSGGIFVIDNFYRFFAIIFLIVLLFVIASSIEYMNGEHNLGIYYILLLFATIGMMLVAAANDILAIFVAWELGSLPVYILVAFQKSKAETGESALKMFLIGAMSSAFILFGISLLYGITGSTSLEIVVTTLGDITDYGPLHILAVMFLLVGFGYKMSAVPFHAWAPDVYQGAPTTVTTFLAAGSKAMGFAAVFRLIVAGLNDIDIVWGSLFALLAVLTMTLGNIVALVQTNIKRMLAYSSIAHAGYIMIALAAVASSPTPTLVGSLRYTVSEFSIAAAEFHILTHALMKIIAFTIVIVVAASIKSENIADYAGLRKKHPWLTFGMTISLLSLQGVPPLAGFVSKFLLFWSAIYADLAWLAVVGIINSGFSIFYYLWIIKLMIIDDAVEDSLETKAVPVDRLAPYSMPRSYQITIAASVLLVIIVGLFPGPFIDFALDAAAMLFS